MPSSWILVTWEARSLYTQRAEFFFCEYHKIKCFLLNKELKTALSCLRQVLATKSLLKMLKNTLYCTLIALFVLKVLKFLYWIFGHVKKRADWKHKTCDVAVCFEIYCTNVHYNFCQGCDVINFEIIHLSFIIKPFFPHDQKVKTKIYESWERKELLRRSKTQFSSF